MRFIPAVLLLSLLGACGQVGDLYLPEKKAEPVQTTAPAAEAAKKKK
ncbi:MAG: lipoprotein [Pseudomonadota bacterium]